MAKRAPPSNGGNALIEEKIYSYEVRQVLRASDRNRVLAAKTPYDRSSVVIFDWKRDEDLNHEKAKIEPLLARVADGLPGATLFTAPKRICLSVPVPLDSQGKDDFEAARRAGEALIRDLQADHLFTGNWNGQADDPPPPPEPPPPQKVRKTFLIFAAVVVIAVGVGFLFSGRGTSLRPHAKIESFFASPTAIAPDETVTLSWNAPDATHVEIWANGALLLTAPLATPTGSTKHSPQTETTYELHAVGEDGVDVISEPRKVTIAASKVSGGVPL